MPSKKVNFIQISDIHLHADPKKELLGVKTEASFDAVLDHIIHKKHIFDFILLTGDLSQDYSIEAYQHLAKKLEKLGKPVYFIPGNHDDSGAMRKVYPTGCMQDARHLVMDHWQLILLDSHIQGKVEGKLSDEQLSYMEKCLRAHPNLFAAVLFHHQPVPVGSAWLDNLGVKNAEQFWSVAEKYPQLNTVFFGHVHQEFDKQIGNIHVYSPPSTCIQFMRNQDEFGLENLPPGYRVVTLHENGKVDTHVERIDRYIGYFDKDAKGY